MKAKIEAVAAARACLQLIEGAHDDQLGRPTRLAAWSVTTLVAHIGAGFGAVADTLMKSGAGKPLSAVDYLLAMSGGSADIDRRARDNAAGKTPDELRAMARDGLDRLVDAVDASSYDVVDSRLGPITAVDYLATRVIEFGVHALDLAAALGVTVDLPRGVTATGCRLLARSLAQRTPGRSVELRVPPYAAVQCVPGPRHTRGTPANVIETDPVTWIELATGRRTWGETVGAGRVRASGERADLSAFLPVVG